MYWGYPVLYFFSVLVLCVELLYYTVIVISCKLNGITCCGRLQHCLRFNGSDCNDGFC